MEMSSGSIECAKMRACAFAAGAGNRLSRSGRMDVDAAVGDHLGAMADEGQHHEDHRPGIDLLGGAQRLVDDQGGHPGAAGKS